MEYEIENPLLNQHVIEIVFMYSKLETLLTCRQVCQIWNEEALRMLEINNQTVAYIKGPDSIQKFLKCMETSPDQPFTTFSIEFGNQKSRNDANDEMAKLLNLLKPRLKHAKFEYEPPIVSNSQDNNEENLLSENSEIEAIKLEAEEKRPPQEIISLPVLESLHIFSTNIFPPTSIICLPVIFNSLATPRLTSLSVQHLYDTECAETVISLINSSSNTISSLKFPCTEFSKLVGRVNLKKLRELDICDLFHGSFATNVTIQCIIDSCPDLEKLSIEFGCRVTFDYIYKLCQTLSHSAKYLKLIIQDKNLLSRTIQRVNFYFPPMPKLKSLFLRYTNPGLLYFIDKIPQLSSLELETPWTKKVRGNIFPGIENRVYDQLTTLNLSEKITAVDVLKISALFPNLKVLCASFANDEALFEVYKNLQSIHCLIIDRNSCITDSGICGINCEELKIFDKNTLSYAESETKEISIADLKNLKTLKLVQAGLSWKSLVFGVSHLKVLQSLSVQTTALKTNDADLNLDNSVLQTLSKKIPSLTNLSIWTRRKTERLTDVELQFLISSFPNWNINFTIQTICSTT